MIGNDMNRYETKNQKSFSYVTVKWILMLTYG